MPKSAWPTATDLTNRLSGLGVAALPAGVVAADEIAAAVSALESVTQIKPFLAEATTQTYVIDPTRRTYVHLNAMYAALNAVRIGGDSLTIGDDVWLDPPEGPYIGLKLVSNVYGDPEEVEVDGKRGYSDSIPDDVWLAVLDYAAASVYETASMAGTVGVGPASEITQDSVRIKFGGGAGEGTAEKLRKKAMAVFARYARVGLG